MTKVTAVKVEMKGQYAKVTLDTGRIVYVPKGHALATVGASV
jgi:hypothetical protein